MLSCTLNHIETDMTLLFINTCSAHPKTPFIATARFALMMLLVLQQLLMKKDLNRVVYVSYLNFILSCNSVMSLLLHLGISLLSYRANQILMLLFPLRACCYRIIRYVHQKVIFLYQYPAIKSLPRDFPCLKFQVHS